MWRPSCEGGSTCPGAIRSRVERAKSTLLVGMLDAEWERERARCFVNAADQRRIIHAIMTYKIHYTVSTSFLPTQPASP